MPSHVVKIPFPYAGDGFTVEHLKVGESRDFGMSAEGLLSEGLIEVGDPIPGEPVHPAVQSAAPAATPPKRGRK